ncbi:MAG: GTP-binding protein [Planctomycetota bacterium]|nr:MAG: GTP-binding protein [Planctomycetota bacterium]
MTGVAVDVLTGFLGSGKTTLLRHVLQHGLDGRRVAIVMNEIGDVGIDGKVITGLKSVERMVELSSGCICCSISGQFSLAVREIVQTSRPHLIIIETTGLADPGPVAGQVRDAGLNLDAIITVVDAANVLRSLEESAAAVHQVEEADFLVINKTDLVTEQELARVEAALDRLNGRAQRRRTRYGQVDTDLLFATSVGRIRSQVHAGGHGHLEADRIEAFTFRGAPGEVLLRSRFERLLRRLPRDLIRAKGIVRFAGEADPVLFSSVCGRADIQPFPLPAAGEPPANQGVFIGRDGRRHEARILRDLERCRPGGRMLDRIL